MYYSYRPLVAFFPFVVTSLNVVRFPKAHAQLFVVSCIIIFFPPFSFLLPSPVVRSLSNAPYTVHRTPYTPRYHHHIRFTLIPLVPLSSCHHRSSSRIFCRLSIHPSIPSLSHTPNIPLHNHIYTLSLTLYLIFLPSTLLPPPSGLGCCFPFLLPFFHRYSSNMSTCPLTSSKVLTQSRTPDFLRSLMISPYTIPTCFFLHSPSLASFFSFHPFRSLIHVRCHVFFFLNLVYFMYVCTVALTSCSMIQFQMPDAPRSIAIPSILGNSSI